MMLKFLIQLLFATTIRANNNDLITSYVSSTYDWDSRSSSVSVSCVNIPKNLSLCSNIGYPRMRIPNLLDHDTLPEIAQQAASWIPLLNIRCHPDTQRFLCSLFCPVCLDHPIYPCRSLCKKVKAGCEKHMLSYGYPWPAMFGCSQFPADNDMCIKSQSVTDSSSEERCRICEQVNTVENILDNYCQSTVAVRVKIKRHDENDFTFRIMKSFKAPNESLAEFKDDLLRLKLREDCCREKMKTQNSFLIMGSFTEGKFNPSFMMPWVVKKSKTFKKSVRMFKKFNCSNLGAIARSGIETISVKAPRLLSKNYEKLFKLKRKNQNNQN